MPELFQRVLAYLLPGKAEKEDGFRLRIEKLSRQGLQVIAIVEVVAPLFMLAAQYFVMPKISGWQARIWQSVAVMCVGVLTHLVARVERRGFPYRLAGWLSGFATGVVLISSALIFFDLGVTADHYIPGQVTSVLLVGVGALPLLPWHTLSLGLAMWAYYVVAGPLAVRWGFLAAIDRDGTHSIFILMITFLSAALSALLYAERLANYRAHQDALASSENLCRANARLLLSENAASLGRLAAAISHELNNPVGALRSAVDTLLLLSARQAATQGDDHQRLVLLQADLRRSIHDSAARLQQTVGRLQRFTNLDKADIQPADINALVNDVVALQEPEIRKSAHLELDLQPISPLLCRPQQLSAVLSSILHNALQATVNGDGRIRVATREVDLCVEVSVPPDRTGASR
jgi:two-component system, NtrC family, sensor kinase